MTDPTPIRKGATDPTPVSNGQVIRVLGFLLLFGAFAPPIAVILWRVATGAWS